MIALLLACAAEEPAPLPTAAMATGVEISGPGWSAAAATLRLTANKAWAEEPAVIQSGGGKPPLEIVADRSEWDLRARTARFEGNVIVGRGGVELRCAALDVRYADANRVNDIVATGGVTVRQGGRSGTAERAELIGETGRITLTGGPRLTEGPNTLAGASITLWLDDERASCAGDGGQPCRLLVEGSALR